MILLTGGSDQAALMEDIEHGAAVGIHVQEYGDVAILTYRYYLSSLEGAPLTQWRATIVRVKRNDRWNTVHAHWIMESKK